MSNINHLSQTLSTFYYFQVIVYEQYLRSFMDDNIHTLFELGKGQCDYEPQTFLADTPNEWGLANRYRLFLSLIYFNFL